MQCKNCVDKFEKLKEIFQDNVRVNLFPSCNNIRGVGYFLFLFWWPFLKKILEISKINLMLGGVEDPQQFVLLHPHEPTTDYSI